MLLQVCVVKIISSKVSVFSPALLIRNQNNHLLTKDLVQVVVEEAVEMADITMVAVDNLGLIEDRQAVVGADPAVVDIQVSGHYWGFKM